jgi:hypothetical protein
MNVRSLYGDGARVRQEPESQRCQRGRGDRWAAINDRRDQEECPKPVEDKANPQ